MASVPCFKFRFTPNWFMVLLSLLTIVFLVYLGFWQIQRAEEKEGMLHAAMIRSKQKPIFWQGQKKLPLQYQQIRTKGYYLPTVFLLDNQHQNHQFGYNVISPLVLDNGTVVLVDRGWVAGAPNRSTFPAVPVPDHKLSVQGTAYFPSVNQWLLGPNTEKKTDSLIILEHLDTKKVSQLLQKSVYPFIIRLDQREEHGFVRLWPTVSMSPVRHRAYAVQWFAMALVVLIIFLALNLKKHEEKHN